MNGINLIPPAILDARRRRRRIRLWSFATAGYAIVLTGSLGAYATGRADTADTAVRLAALSQGIERGRTDLRQLRERAVEAQREADAARMMAGHPDWSVLLALLAAPLTPDMTLDSCELARTDPPAPTTPAPATPAATAAPRPAAMPTGYRVTLTGLARTQSQVTGYALELERLGVDGRNLFENVALLEAKGRRVGSTEVVAFRIECLMTARASRGGAK